MIRRVGRFMLRDSVKTIQELVAARDLIVTLSLKALIATLRLVECLVVVVFLMLTVGRFLTVGTPYSADAGIPTDLATSLIYPALAIAALFLTEWMILRLDALVPGDRDVPIWGSDAPLWDRELDG